LCEQGTQIFKDGDEQMDGCVQALEDMVISKFSVYLSYGSFTSPLLVNQSESAKRIGERTDGLVGKNIDLEVFKYIQQINAIYGVDNEHDDADIEEDA
jgi:hypothetical protein